MAAFSDPPCIRQFIYAAAHQNQSLQQSLVGRKQGNLGLADTLYSTLMARPIPASRPSASWHFTGLCSSATKNHVSLQKKCWLCGPMTVRAQSSAVQFGAVISQVLRPRCRSSMIVTRDTPRFCVAPIIIVGANTSRLLPALNLFDANLQQRARPIQVAADYHSAIRTGKGGARRVPAFHHHRMLDNLLDAHGEEALRRIRRAITHFHDKSETWQHELQQPTFFYVPGLRAKPWFERTDFSWVGEFEQRADAIHAEYQRIVATRKQSLKPYITTEQHAPQTSWGHLIETENRLPLHGLKGGRRVVPNASDMPITMAALELVELPDCAGNSPRHFSRRSHRESTFHPDHGLANYKLVAHLALNIPEKCGIRVGGQSREWHQGHVFLRRQFCS